MHTSGGKGELQFKQGEIGEGVLYLWCPPYLIFPAGASPEHMRQGLGHFFSRTFNQPEEQGVPMTLKNGMELILGKAAPTDAGEIIEYLNIVGGESDNLLFGKNGFPMPVEAEARFIESMNQSDTSALFVGRIGGRVACVGSLQSPPRERTAHQCDLALSVKREFWNLGVGTALLETMIAFAKQTGKTEILHLGVRADNEAAIRLYQKMGFVEIGRYPKFFKINGAYADEILMNLYL